MTELFELTQQHAKKLALNSVEFMDYTRESWVSSGQERDWSIDKSYLRNATIMSSTITYITILIITYITISIYIVIVGDTEKLQEYYTEKPIDKIDRTQVTIMKL